MEGNEGTAAKVVEFVRVCANIEPERWRPANGGPDGMVTDRVDPCGDRPAVPIVVVFGANSEVRASVTPRGSSALGAMGVVSCWSSSSFSSSRLLSLVECVSINIGFSPSDCTAMSLSCSRSWASWSGGGARISITSGRIIGMGGWRIDGRRRPNLNPNTSEAATRRLPRDFLSCWVDPSVVLGRKLSYEVNELEALLFDGKGSRSRSTPAPLGRPSVMCCECEGYRISCSPKPVELEVVVGLVPLSPESFPLMGSFPLSFERVWLEGLRTLLAENMSEVVGSLGWYCLEVEWWVSGEVNRNDRRLGEVVREAGGNDISVGEVVEYCRRVKP